MRLLGSKRSSLFLLITGVFVWGCGNSTTPRTVLPAGPEPQPIDTETDTSTGMDSAVTTPHPEEPKAGDGIEVTLGEQHSLLETGDLGLHYFPDMATIRVSSNPERLLVTSAISTWLVTGPSLTELDSAVEVLTPGAAGEFDNGYAGISGVYRNSNNLLYGYYHGEDHEDLPNLPGTFIPGFNASIGLATSDDEGATWTKLGAVVTSSVEKGVNWDGYPEQADFGAGEPGTVVSQDGRYLYLFYTEHSRLGGRGVQICLARADLTAGPPTPGSFQKYHDGSFGQPGLGGLDTPVLSGQEFNYADALFAHPTYSEYLGQYVMVVSIFDFLEVVDGQVGLSGIYVAYSLDAIKWSTPERLIADYSSVVPKRSLSWEANILWDDAGQTGQLVYGHSEQWGAVADGDQPHHMVSRKITFARGGSL